MLRCTGRRPDHLSMMSLRVRSILRRRPIGRFGQAVDVLSKCYIGPFPLTKQSANVNISDKYTIYLLHYEMTHEFFTNFWQSRLFALVTADALIFDSRFYSDDTGR